MVTVAYLGPPGTFTDAALQRFAATGHTAALVDGHIALPVDSPGAALEAVRSGRADYACVPVENSVDGTVNPTGDALAMGERLQIFGETELDVVFSILARPGTRAEDVRVLRTHPVGAAQVRGWVAEHLPGAVIETSASNAAAAAEVARGEADAAAAPARAGELYGLEELAGEVADVPGARTRFVLVGHPAPAPAPTGADRTAFVFGVDHVPNALVQALTEISIRGLDLTRIESRPTRVERFTYLFHVDVAGHIADPAVAEMLAALHSRTAALRFLGSWPLADGARNGSPPPDIATHHRWVDSVAAGGDDDPVPPFATPDRSEDPR